MLLTTEQHSRVAAAFEAAAANQNYPAEERAELSRKAKLWRWLAKRAEEKAKAPPTSVAVH